MTNEPKADAAMQTACGVWQGCFDAMVADGTDRQVAIEAMVSVAVGNWLAKPREAAQHLYLLSLAITKAADQDEAERRTAH